MATREIGYYSTVGTPALDDEFLTQQKGVTKKSEEIFDVVPTLSGLSEEDLSLSDLIIGNDGSNKKISLQQLLTYVKSLVALYVYGGVDVSLTKLQDTDELISGVWSNKTDMPSPARSAHAASTILNIGYVYGGDSGTRLQDTDEYDPDVWVSKTDMLSPARRYLAAATILNKGYVFGGDSGGTQDTDEYDPDTWASKTNMSPGRFRHAATTIKDKGYVFGGAGTLQTTAQYNPDTWNEDTLMLSGRQSHAATNVLGKGYVFGGRNITNDIIGSTQEYDSGTWVEKGEMLTAVETPAASTILNKAYVCGGNSSTTYFQNSWEYTPKIDTWISAAGGMPTPGRNQFAASTIGG
jgi:lipid-binding SYLF domain-containing protein